MINMRGRGGGRGGRGGRGGKGNRGRIEKRGGARGRGGMGRGGRENEGFLIQFPPCGVDGGPPQSGLDRLRLVRLIVIRLTPILTVLVPPPDSRLACDLRP